MAHSITFDGVRAAVQPCSISLASAWKVNAASSSQCLHCLTLVKGEALSVKACRTQRFTPKNYAGHLSTMEAGPENIRVPAQGMSRRTLFTSVTTGIGYAVAEPLLRALPALADVSTPPALPGLDPNMYGDAKQTAQVLKIVAAKLDDAVSFKNAGNLLRLAFHDSGTFNGLLGTGGANGSIQYELKDGANSGLALGVNIIRKVKKQVDAESPVPIGVADLVALAGAKAVKVTGGPVIKVPVGRPDVTVADPPGQLPSELEDAASLKRRFGNNGYSVQDLVALSGAHTIGISRTHPPAGLPLDPFTPNTFDTKYFVALLNPEKPLGFFRSDRALLEDPETKAFVVKFAYDKQAFFDAFSDAYVKLTLKGVEPTSA